MHESAYDKFQVFVSAYLAGYSRLSVLDVGSHAIGISDTHRPTIESRGWTYLGMDLEAGPNVDQVVADAYEWREFKDNSFDVVLCSQVLEHSRYPWRIVEQIARVLRPSGLTFMIAPSAGHVHRYPEDCFRYYPDGLPALAENAGLQVIDAHVQSRPVYRSNIWLDAMLVGQKPGSGEFPQLAPRDSFKARDAELAEKFDPLRRIEHVRTHLSRALKSLTRRV